MEWSSVERIMLGEEHRWTALVLLETRVFSGESRKT